MRKIFLIVALVCGFAAARGAEQDENILREAWARVMVERGLRPGQELSPKEWNRMLDWLVDLTRSENLQPGAALSQEEWQDIMSMAGAAGGATEDGEDPFRGEPPPDVPPPPPDFSAPEIPGRPDGPPPPVEFTPPTPPSEAVPPPTVVPAPIPLSVPLPTASAQPAAPRVQNISLDLKNMDVIEVLKILSRQGDLNMVVGSDVRGRVTVFLKDVEFWEALRTILETNELAYIREGHVLKVVGAREYERLFGEPFSQKKTVKAVPLANLKAGVAKEVLEPFKSKIGNLVVNEVTNTLFIDDAPEQIEALERMILDLDMPQETRVFALNYAVVDDLLPKVVPLVSKNYGTIQSDKRSNTLVLRDNPQRVREIAELVKAFDVPHKTVLIEAKIVQVTLTDEHQWGVDWSRSFRYSKDIGPGRGGLPGVERVYSGSAKGTFRSLDKGTDGLVFNIKSLSGLDISAAMRFLETVGNTKLLSSPRIMALNNQEASIHVGTKEPSVTRTIVNPGSTTTNAITTENVTFVDVGINLTVTPVIGQDGFITMKIKPEINSVDKTITTGSSGGDDSDDPPATGSIIPVVRGSRVETSVRVKDGVTVVIAGLIEDKKDKKDSAVPILGRIPIIGMAFRGRSNKVEKTELIIFLTPHLITGDADAQDAEPYFPEKFPNKKKGFFGRREKETHVPG